MSSGYFAFIRRDASRRYHATLPDFPGCSATAETVEQLAEAVRNAVHAHMPGSAWPAPTTLERLPRQSDDHDGYWLMVDLAASA